MDPYLESRYWPIESHVKAYFYMEQHQQRPADAHWGSFNDSEREYAGRHFPALSFQIDRPEAGLQSDGVLLLCIPEDFARRQRFYVLMWSDHHAPGDPAQESSDLEELMQSLAIGPLVSPGVLLGLTAESTPPVSSAAKLNAGKLARKFAKATGMKRSYRSEFVLIDRANPDLQSNDQTSLHWAMDYMAPDRFHVVQKGWMEKDHQYEKGRQYVYDEWIDLAAEHFDNAGIWSQFKRTEKDRIRTEISKSLRVDDLVKLLASGQPAGLTEHRFMGRTYYAFTFSLDPTSGLLAYPVIFSSLVDAPFVARIWVDADSGLIAKADVTGGTMKSNGKPATIEIARMFGRWDEDFLIKAPQVMEAFRN